MNYTVIEPDMGQAYARIISGIAGQSPADVDKKKVIGLFREYGAVLFRGFLLNQDTLNQLTAQFCSGFVTNTTPGRILVSQDGRTQSVNTSSEAFPLHPEMSQVPWRPDIAWFACASPPITGGETTLCDGIALANALPSELREMLEARSFLYKRRIDKRECEYWLGIKNPTAEDMERSSDIKPYRFSINNGIYYKSYQTPVLHRPMYSQELAFGSFLLFRRLMHKEYNYPTFEDESIVPDSIVNIIKDVSEQITIGHVWQQCDILMIDNTRFMHGRAPIADPKQRRIVTQFGYASFHPEFDSLVEAEPWRIDPRILASPLVQF
ncbi:MAG TPA: hypothetical protein ENJ80_07580 [Gammaproteobacteria bacterium]|nr:hypothetical protein [Gammaproteobacteria bacterium]